MDRLELVGSFAIGMREALSWLKSLKVEKHTIVVLDCLELIYALKGKHNGSFLGGIAFDIKCLLNQFNSIAVVFVER